jgi:hypothetical protein
MKRYKLWVVKLLMCAPMFRISIILFCSFIYIYPFFLLVILIIYPYFEIQLWQKKICYIYFNNHKKGEITLYKMSSVGYVRLKGIMSTISKCTYSHKTVRLAKYSNGLWIKIRTGHVIYESRRTNNNLGL